MTDASSIGLILTGVFLQYGIYALVGLVLFYWLLPETRGQTLEEVELLFSRSPCICSPLRFFRRWSNDDAGDDDDSSGPVKTNSAKTVQYVQIRGLNRDHKQLEEEED